MAARAAAWVLALGLVLTLAAAALQASAGSGARSVRTVVDAPPLSGAQLARTLAEAAGRPAAHTQPPARHRRLMLHEGAPLDYAPLAATGATPSYRGAGGGAGERTAAGNSAAAVLARLLNLAPPPAEQSAAAPKEPAGQAVRAEGVAVSPDDYRIVGGWNAPLARYKVRARAVLG